MGLLDEVENEDPATPDVGTNSELNVPGENAEGITFTSLEVGGIKMEGESITDALGNTWQVAGDNVADLDDLYAGDVYKIPRELSDHFHVQLIRLEQLKEYMMRRFVPVTLKELGVPEELLKTGHPLDGYHVVGDSIMVKIPHAIHKRLQDRKVKEARERLLALEPTEAMVKQAGIDGGMLVEHRLGFTGADPSKRDGIFVDENGRKR